MEKRVETARQQVNKLLISTHRTLAFSFSTNKPKTKSLKSWLMLSMFSNSCTSLLYK